MWDGEPPPHTRTPIAEDPNKQGWDALEEEFDKISKELDEEEQNLEEGEKGEEDGMRRMRTCSRNLPSQQNLDNLTSLKAPRSLHSICFGFVFF